MRPRPKEHTVFHVLAFVKVAFSTDGLSKFKEADCANNEAFKYVVCATFLVSQPAHVIMCSLYVLIVANVRHANSF